MAIPKVYAIRYLPESLNPAQAKAILKASDDRHNRESERVMRNMLIGMVASIALLGFALALRAWQRPLDRIHIKLALMSLQFISMINALAFNFLPKPRSPDLQERLAIKNDGAALGYWELDRIVAQVREDEVALGQLVEKMNFVQLRHAAGWIPRDQWNRLLEPLQGEAHQKEKLLLRTRDIQDNQALLDILRDSNSEVQKLAKKDRIFAVNLARILIFNKKQIQPEAIAQALGLTYIPYEDGTKFKLVEKDDFTGINPYINRFKQGEALHLDKARLLKEVETASEEELGYLDVEISTNFTLFSMAEMAAWVRKKPGLVRVKEQCVKALSEKIANSKTRSEAYGFVKMAKAFYNEQEFQAFIQHHDWARFVQTEL